MDEARKRELASIHDSVLDGKFTTFEHDGFFFHELGLMQAWARGYTDPNYHMLTEPPQWTPELRKWLAVRGGRVFEGPISGPPLLVFPSQEVAAEFKAEWHDRARERYPYEQRHLYERTVAVRNREILERATARKNSC